MALRKIVLPWEGHPHKDGNWYAWQKTRMTEDEIASELDRSYSKNTAGRVFPQFIKRHHWIQERIPVIKELPVYRIWDFGGVNGVLYGQEDNYFRRRVLHERVLGTPEDASSTPDQIDMALEDSAKLFKGCTFIDICDPAGKIRDFRGGDPDIIALEKKGIFARCDRLANLPTEGRTERLIKMVQYDLQRTIQGDDAFGLYCSADRSEGCPTLLAAFEGEYGRKKDRNGNISDQIDKRHPYGEVMDCLLYWYGETKDMRETKKGSYKPTQPKGSVNPFTGY